MTNDELEEKTEDNVSLGSIGSLEDLDNFDSDLEEEIQKKKKYKRGVVYLPFIPPSMNPVILRRFLSEYAVVERIYLQPEIKKKAKKRKIDPKNVKYSEGWVEFLKKRDAKKIADVLNNTPMGGKKKSKFREYLWNLKYLPRFKWIHLCERLSYEKAVRQQRLRAEVSQAKKIANHFAESVDKEERMKKKNKGLAIPAAPTEVLSKRFAQKESLEEKESKKKVEKSREDFLKSLFA
ncbi:activator of basal transcription 1 [Halyomorpha halys]|uniref:activator of basal transcription 1 n=1 Tax=Halyomorpha halys TaxID=286706 RepID=UPI0006D4E1EA|nr:activator of basal transcription 1 [Halyomorpha halys]